MRIEPVPIAGGPDVLPNPVPAPDPNPPSLIQRPHRSPIRLYRNPNQHFPRILSYKARGIG